MIRSGTRLLVTSVMLISGCQRPDSPDAVDAPAPPAPTSSSRSVRGTIGEVTYIQGTRMLSVRGYGLVVGLGKNGSRTCPERIRKRVSAEIRQKYRLGDSRIGLGNISSERLISDPDTAVVLVLGVISAGAVEGNSFDLMIQALPGTETTSLDGGRLLNCDLRYYRTVDSGTGTVQEGKIVAHAEGRVFLLPGLEPDDMNALRVARIIGGGQVSEARRVYLRLTSPSYALAGRIRSRINTVYGQDGELAVADSPDQISLSIPIAFRNRELEFVDLVRHVYVNEDAGYADGLAEQLGVELEDPEAPINSIGLAWQSLGMSVRPVIRNYYNNRHEQARFISARTGLRLGDDLAVEPMDRIAGNHNSALRMLAIEELGDARDVRGAHRAVRQIIDTNPYPEIRIAAYEAMVFETPAEEDGPMVGDHFRIDHIRSQGKPLIYAKTEGVSRLAVMGKIECKTPCYYKHRRGAVQIMADAGSDELTVVRYTPQGHRVLAHCSLDIAELALLLGDRAREKRDGEVTGLGMTYAQVVEVLSDLCAAGAIDAKLVLQETAMPTPGEEDRWIGRPDSEL